MEISRTGSIDKTTGARHTDLVGGCLFSQQASPLSLVHPHLKATPFQGAESENGWLAGWESRVLAEKMEITDAKSPEFKVLPKGLIYELHLALLPPQKKIRWGRFLKEN